MKSRDFRRWLILSLTCCLLPLAAADLPNFAEMIKTPSGIDRTMEYCDGHPAFETALANWLERTEPFSAEERQAIRQASLRLLVDTTDSQLMLALADGLLRHSLEEVKRNPTSAAEEMADVFFRDTRRAIGAHKAKNDALAIAAYGLSADGTIADNRQSSFLVRFLDRTEPQGARNAHPAQPLPVVAAKVQGVQSDTGLVSRR